MIHCEDNARYVLLTYLNKPRKALELPDGKTTILKKFKKDTTGQNIYIIDYDYNGIADEEINNSIQRHEEFKNINHVQLYRHKTIAEKYLVIFNEDFPSWLINSLKEIGKQPSDFGFPNQKGKFHSEIRVKERQEGFYKILIELNKQHCQMLQTLKDIFMLINHKP